MHKWTKHWVNNDSMAWLWMTVQCLMRNSLTIWSIIAATTLFFFFSIGLMFLVYLNHYFSGHSFCFLVFFFLVCLFLGDKFNLCCPQNGHEVNAERLWLTDTLFVLWFFFFFFCFKLENGMSNSNSKLKKNLDGTACTHWINLPSTVPRMRALRCSDSSRMCIL